MAGEEGESKQENQEHPDGASGEQKGEKPDTTKQVAGFVSMGVSFMDGLGAGKLVKGVLSNTDVIAGGALAAVAAEEAKKHYDGAASSRTRLEIKAEQLEKPVLGASAAGSAMAALGIYNGVKEGAEALKKGDKLGVALSTTDAAMGATNLTIQTLAMTGREVAPLLEKFTKFGGTAVLVAQSAKAIYDAKGNLIDTDEKGHITGLGGKGEVAIKEALKAGTGIGVSSFVGGVGTGAAAAVAPVVIAGGVVFVVDKATEKLIDNRHAYQEIDKRNAEESKAAKYDTGGKPLVVADYKHLMAGLIQASDKIDWSKMQGQQKAVGPMKIDLRTTPAAITHDVDTGIGFHKQKADIDVLGKMDMKNPANRAELSRALDREIASQKEQIKNNDSIVPVWVRDGTKSAGAMTTAQEKLAWLTAAKQELKEYGDDLVARQIVASKFHAPAESPATAPEVPPASQIRRPPPAVTARAPKL